MRSRQQTGGRRSAPSPPKAELNLTPMIDVVFQLLIYFLLGTSFAVGEQTFRMDLPEIGSGSAVARRYLSMRETRSPPGLAEERTAPTELGARAMTSRSASLSSEEARMSSARRSR